MMNRKNKRVVAQQIETLSESLADDFLEGLKSESPLMREQQRQGDCLEISSKESVKAGIFSITATPFGIKQANEANFDGLNLPASTHDCDLTRGEPDFSEIFDLSDYLLAFTREQVDYDERRHTAAAHALVSQKLEINSREKRIHEFNQIAFWLQENRPEVWSDIQKFMRLNSFSMISQKWNLSTEESNALFGLESEQSARITYLTRIYKALSIVHGNALACVWVRMPNTNAIFGGKTPLEFMIAGGVDAIKGVQKLLDSRVAGN